MGILKVLRQIKKKIFKNNCHYKGNSELVLPIRIENKTKSILEENIKRLKAICSNTRKFRTKKKLGKRITRLENKKLLQIRRM